MSQALYGRIFHRLHIPESSSDVPVSRKRRRRSGSHRSDHEEHSHDLHQHDQKQLQCAGFVFVPNENSPHDHEYLLSLPKDLQKVAYDAVRRKQEVVIMRWTEIRILPPSSSCEDSRRRSTSLSAAQERTTCMLEVHSHGLAMLPSSNQAQDGAATMTSSDDFDENANLWTLTQFWRKELVDSEALKSTRCKFDLVATVDAISPIIALDPCHPFALIEVYDPANTDVTAIVVLNGREALTCSSAIFPSDTLIFHNVVYKAWTVPTILHQEDGDRWKDRVPSHVFVATESGCISWGHISPLHGPLVGGSTDEHLSSIGRPAPMITPVNLLTTIQGRVTHVETTTASSGAYTATIIDYIDLLLQPDSLSKAPEYPGTTNRTQQYCRLYLTHFPMPTALQWSLRDGAIVDASNIHKILDWSPDHVHRGGEPSGSESKEWIICGACLRSTLVLLKNGVEAIENPVGARLRSSNDDLTHSTYQSTCGSPLETQSTHISSAPAAFNDHIRKEVNSKCKTANTSCFISLTNSVAAPWLSYRFWKIQRTYLEAVYTSHVDDWVRRSFRGPLCVDTRMSRSASKNWITELLLQDSDSNRNETVKEDFCRGSGKNSSSHPRRRCPYAEFFDHPYGTTDDIGALDNSNDCGCLVPLMDGDQPTACAAVLVDLSDIRSAGQILISKRIATRTSESGTMFSVGWTGSIIATPEELLQDPRNRSNDHHMVKPPWDCFVGGFVSEIHSHPSASVAAISDAGCQVPISFSRERHEAQIGDFVMGKVDRITISCLCLGFPRNYNVTEGGAFRKEEQQEYINSSASLPTIYSAKSHLLGGCSLMIVCGLLFVSSIQIRCRQSNVSFTNESSKTGEKVLDKGDVVSIEEWLTSPFCPNGSSAPSTLKSTIVRRRFQSKIHSNGTWKCCKMFVCGCPSHVSSHPESESCCLQSFEYNVSVVNSTARNLAFNRKLEHIWPGACLSEAQKALGSSFWALGDSGRTCGLTFGGCEDIVTGSRCCSTYVHLYFPSTAVHLTDRGYIRLASSHEEVDAILEPDDDDQFNSRTKRSPSTLFDFVGGTKVFNGMLCRRPRRRNVFGPAVAAGARVVGELCTTAPSLVIPPCTISHLFRLLCHELREPDESTMNPSLVRRISCGTLLGVSFCHVQSLCMRCRSPLVAPIANKKQRQAYGHTVNLQPSFWHLPHSQESLLRAHHTQPSPVESSMDVPIPIRQSRFRCPNKCPIYNLGVKWECSGILDDGTGQATLYADGDVALTLLGMSAETIQWIEEGIWSTDCGFLLFKKSLPPSKHLRDIVSHALSQKTTVTELIRLLPPKDRAEYLLQKHCRSSNAPRRPLEYYVRCKPLPDKMRHLNHSTIDNFFIDRVSGDGDHGRNTCRVASIHRGETITYTLPSLKLELVDCGIPSWDRGSGTA